MKNIIIIGGGTSGWISAFYFAQKLDRDTYNILLFSSDSIGTIGVGESTIPYVANFLTGLGVSEKELLQETQGTIKMGILFENWNPEKSFIHPFTRGMTSLDIADESIAYWFSPLFPDANYDEYADIAYFLFQENKISKEQDGISKYEYAYHLDAHLLSIFLKKKSIELGVQYNEGIVECVSNSQGHITAVIYKENHISCDFVVDCSGFHSQIIDRDKNNTFISFQDELICNKALFARSQKDDYYPVYTLSSAMDFGWRWKIPLQNMYGNGYVFSDTFVSVEDAKQEFSTKTGIPIEQMRLVSFHPGYYKMSWYHNSLSIGLSTGFVEPLEATGIYFICKQLDLFGENIRGGEIYNHGNLQEIYNKTIEEIYIQVKDFIVFHYVSSKRNDTTFWNYYKHVSHFSDSFQKIFSYIQASFPKEIFNHSQHLFRRESWIRIMMGQGYVPEKKEKYIETDIENKIKKIISLYKIKNQNEAKGCIPHKKFLNTIICADSQE